MAQISKSVRERGRVRCVSNRGTNATASHRYRAEALLHDRSRFVGLRFVGLRFVGSCFVGSCGTSPARLEVGFVNAHPISARDDRCAQRPIGRF